MENPIKGIKSSVEEIKQSIDGIKHSVDEMKQSVDGAKQNAQETVEQAKDTSAEFRQSMGQIKSSVQETKTVVMEAKDAVKGTRDTENSAASASAPANPVPVKEGDGFYLRGDAGLIGEITYLSLTGTDTWVLNHTYVAPPYRGRNLARTLLDSVVEEARKQGKRILPACSYALDQFKQNPEEFQDVWRKA
ncbi:GNAT family N-acetyltransferase [Paenibacillus sp. CN-4]|uniref:GNAT family N-acetyltransferase n=1 Tax=Paenibacillus nanchangensis TaxID=3348343 RepID=UPI00397DCC69